MWTLCQESKASIERFASFQRIFFTWILDLSSPKVKELCGSKNVSLIRAFSSLEVAILYWKFTIEDRHIDNSSTLRNLCTNFLCMQNWLMESKFYDGVVERCLGLTKTFWLKQKRMQTKRCESNRQVSKFYYY